MDWALAIDRNRDALLRVAAMLFAAAGLTPGGTVTGLPRHMRNAVLRLLRPAESATRRLIVIVAQGLSAQPRAAAVAPTQPIPRGTGDRAPSFRLFDPRKRFGAGPRRPARPEARITVFGLDEPVFRETRIPSSDDPIGAKRLCGRLHALRRALEDLPRQARRLAGLRARRLAPLRPGRPPGHRKRPVHEVDVILGDCHGLARALALQKQAPP